MTPSAYSEPVARIAFYAFFVAFVALEWRAQLRSRIRRSSTVDRGSRSVLIACIAVGMTAGFVLAVRLPAAAIPYWRWPVFVIGLLLMCAGIVVRQWAIAVLGRFFTTDVRVHAGQTVVDTGPYRWVRHPSYTGAMCTFAGLGLALGNWAALAVLVVLPGIGFIVRIRVEEATLLFALGEPYRAYAATRKRLVPGLW